VSITDVGIGFFFALPGNDTLSFFRICRTEVCYLSSFELCKCRLPSKRSKKEMNPQDEVSARILQTQIGKETHSRTALAESVVLNLAKVFTYSRVLLYTLHKMIKKVNFLFSPRIYNIRDISENPRSVRRILIPILQQVFDLGYQQTTSIVELWSKF
jgi:hypothetical protein